MSKTHFCFSKHFVVAIAVLFILGVVSFFSFKLLNTQTSTTTKAAASNLNSCKAYQSMKICKEKCTDGYCTVKTFGPNFYKSTQGFCCPAKPSVTPSQTITTKGNDYDAMIEQFKLEPVQIDLLSKRGITPLHGFPTFYTNSLKNIDFDNLNTDGTSDILDYDNDGTVIERTVQLTAFLDYLPPKSEKTAKSVSMLGEISVSLSVSNTHYLYSYLSFFTDTDQLPIVVLSLSNDNYISKYLKSDLYVEYDAQLLSSEAVSKNINGSIVFPIHKMFLSCQNNSDKYKKSCLVFGYEKLKEGDTPSTNNIEYKKYPSNYLPGGYVFKYCYLAEDGACK